MYINPYISSLLLLTDVMTDLYEYINPRNNKPSSMISDEVYGIIMDQSDRLNSAIIYDRDYSYNYFGFKVSEGRREGRLQGQ